MPPKKKELQEALASAETWFNPAVALGRPAVLPTPDCPDTRAALLRCGLRVTAATTVAEIMSAIHDVVSYLTCDCVIVAKHKITGVETRFRIAEVESYVTHDLVPYMDPFPHNDVLQREPGLWYFHRKGGTFKGGSFKGMDITFGTDKIPCGVLVRSIVAVNPTDDATKPQPPLKESLVDGPCLVVNKLLESCGETEIKGLVTNPLGRLTVLEDQRLRLLPSQLPRFITDNRIMLAPRVGLIPRQTAHVGFAGSLLRFVTPEVAPLMKHRAGLIAGALAVYRIRSEERGALGAVALHSAIKRYFATKGEVDGWTDAPRSGAMSEAAAEDALLLSSDKLNTAAGAAALVKAALRRGFLESAIPTPSIS
jgi:3-methyladenine DNA glycosylase Mpg